MLTPRRRAARKNEEIDQGVADHQQGHGSDGQHARSERYDAHHRRQGFLVHLVGGLLGSGGG
jgi:hypothetical protein